MLRRDSISGLVCLAISLVMLAMTLGLPPASMVPIGPSFYPRVVLSVTAILSVILIVLDLHAARSNAAVPSRPGVAPNYRLVLATFVLFGLYIALLPKLGFRISTVLFVLALQITLEWPRNPMRWLLAIAIAIGTSFICHLIFEHYLSVLLPRGTWSDM